MYQPKARLTIKSPYDSQLPNTVNPNGYINTLSDQQKLSMIETLIGKQQGVRYIGETDKINWDYLQVPGMHDQENEVMKRRIDDMFKTYDDESWFSTAFPIEVNLNEVQHVTRIRMNKNLPTKRSPGTKSKMPTGDFSSFFNTTDWYGTNIEFDFKSLLTEQGISDLQYQIDVMGESIVLFTRILLYKRLVTLRDPWEAYKFDKIIAESGSMDHEKALAQATREIYKDRMKGWNRVHEENFTLQKLNTAADDNQSYVHGNSNHWVFTQEIDAHIRLYNEVHMLNQTVGQYEKGSLSGLNNLDALTSIKRIGDSTVSIQRNFDLDDCVWNPLKSLSIVGHHYILPETTTTDPTEGHKPEFGNITVSDSKYRRLQDIKYIDVNSNITESSSSIASIMNYIESNHGNGGKDGFVYHLLKNPAFLRQRFEIVHKQGDFWAEVEAAGGTVEAAVVSGKLVEVLKSIGLNTSDKAAIIKSLDYLFPLATFVKGSGKYPVGTEGKDDINGDFGEFKKQARFVNTSTGMRTKFEINGKIMSVKGKISDLAASILYLGQADWTTLLTKKGFQDGTLPVPWNYMVSSSQEIYKVHNGHRILPLGGTLKRVTGYSIVNQQTQNGQKIIMTHDQKYGAWLTSPENYTRAANMAVKDHVRGGGTTLRAQFADISEDKALSLQEKTAGDLLVLLAPSGAKSPDYFDLTGITNEDDEFAISWIHAHACYGFKYVTTRPLDPCDGRLFESIIASNRNALMINVITAPGPYIYKDRLTGQEKTVYGIGAWKELGPQVHAYRYGEKTYKTVKQY